MNTFPTGQLDYSISTIAAIQLYVLTLLLTCAIIACKGTLGGGHANSLSMHKLNVHTQI